MTSDLTSTKEVEIELSTRKLGILIESAGEGNGHVIADIKSHSPLLNFVAQGDIIVGVNSTDTRNMTGAGLTSMLTKSAASGKMVLTIACSSSASSSKPVLASNSPNSVKNITAESVEEKTLPVTEPISNTAQQAPNGGNIRTIDVPSGKLGIILERATSETGAPAGHAVNTVKPGSQLTGLVQTGDIIVGVNGIDTKGLSIAELTTLLTRTAKEARTFSIASSNIDVQPAVINTQHKPVDDNDDDDVPQAPVIEALPFSPKDGVSYHTVDVPKGNLGLVFEKLENGHVVGKVKATSPLTGLVIEGDIIVSLNDVDVQSVSSAALSSMLARASKDRRVLTVIRDQQQTEEARPADKDSDEDGEDDDTLGTLISI